MSASASSIRITWRSTNFRHRCTLSKSPPTARPPGGTCQARPRRRWNCRRLLATSRLPSRHRAWSHPRNCDFRFKLEGQDSDWREVANDRQVQYSNLAPRNYTFRVKAANNSGVWNEDGAVLHFSIAPAYYQTRWFEALVVAGAFALVWAGYRVRVRQVARDYQRRLDERVNERTRIARELHDTLLQSFHGLLLRFQTALYLLPDRPADAKKQLAGAIDHAAKAITEGRDAVQGLRASTVERNDLAMAIRTLGDELATLASADSPPTFSVAVEGQTRDLHPIVRDEIYKIAAEALRNAFRHAHAGRVEVEIRYDAGQFRLRVRDDGKGIDPAVLANQGLEGHYGLRGMPERAALIGGKLAVWSEAAQGRRWSCAFLPASFTRHPRGAPGGHGSSLPGRRQISEETRLDHRRSPIRILTSTTIQWCAKGLPVSSGFSRI